MQLQNLILKRVFEIMHQVPQKLNTEFDLQVSFIGLTSEVASLSGSTPNNSASEQESQVIRVNIQYIIQG